ncbi:ankyrin repeat domain-containing protein [Streptomyces vilmorinianum]|uniref:ankyrin repeat domain-containing protein n=1 Tax=Streptomyces vilmorinianum TaxID=3051092 RepID=UPI0010FB9742|nr:ankyrin repeat domain-containing protein [Streptomyces vilmorinianum]
MSTLFDAILDGDADSVVRLLRSGVSPEADDEGETALYRAALANEPGIVRLLLAAGADPARGSGEQAGDLPLCGAACGGHTEVVRALLAAGAQPDQPEEYGMTAMDWAAQLGHAETVRALLEYGADPGRPRPGGPPPLVAAARRGSAASVRALLEYGAGPVEDALREARRWIGVDIAEELRRGLLETSGGGRGGDAYGETVVRRVHEEGGVTVVVELLRADGAPGFGNEQQTGHAAIATLLETALGVRAPHEELAERAVRCGDPELDDWTETVVALTGRGDEETYRAAATWCTSEDPLRRALGADVLGGLKDFRPRAVQVLRRLAAREAREAPGGEYGPTAPGPAGRAATAGPGMPAATATAGAAWVGDEGRSPACEPARAVVAALGQCGEPAALPELLAFASHPDEEVRRALGCALTGLVPAGDARAVETLVALSRDHDSGVRDWATLALAEVPEDTPVLREALTARLGDSDPDTVAEAARGLAIRQDARAVEVLAGILADGDPAGAARDTALAAVEFVRDPRVRKRLEWTSPRCR